jgi:hypothetical protein
VLWHTTAGRRVLYAEGGYRTNSDRQPLAFCLADSRIQEPGIRLAISFLVAPISHSLKRGQCYFTTRHLPKPVPITWPSGSVR